MKIKGLILRNLEEPDVEVLLEQKSPINKQGDVIISRQPSRLATLKRLGKIINFPIKVKVLIKNNGFRILNPKQNDFYL